MANIEDRSPEDEQTYFIRGMQTLEVSVAVLWDTVKRSEVNLVGWWETHVKSLKAKKKDSKEELKPWQVQVIATDPWEEWDISVLSYAIRNCTDLPKEDHESLRECAKKLNDMRSDCLCHEPRAQIAFDKYIRILQTSMKCYKRLIAEKEAYMEYVKQLKNISKYRIRDQETESWLALLKSRDEEMRHSMTEEELRDVHVHLVDKVKNSMGDVNQGVTTKQHIEQHMAQHQSAQAISNTKTEVNNYLTINMPPMQAPVHTTGIGAHATPNAMPKEEAKLLDGCSTSQSKAQTPVSILNEHCQRNSYERPNYAEERVGEQEFKYIVTYQGEAYEGPIRRGKNEAKHAAAQMIMERFNIG